MTTQTEALNMALECAERCESIDGMYSWADTITAIKEALAQPEQQEQLRFEVDGEMLTASQLIGVELFNFQQATKCDTVAEFLAQSEQEPVAWPCVIAEADFSENTVTLVMQCTDYKVSVGKHWLSTTPPQRTWVGLDPEEIRKTNHHMVDGAYHYSFKQGAEWAEAKLKEKNT